MLFWENILQFILSRDTLHTVNQHAKYSQLDFHYITEKRAELRSRVLSATKNYSGAKSTSWFIIHIIIITRFFILYFFKCYFIYLLKFFIFYFFYLEWLKF